MGIDPNILRRKMRRWEFVIHPFLFCRYYPEGLAGRSSPSGSHFLRLLTLTSILFVTVVLLGPGTGVADATQLPQLSGLDQQGREVNLSAMKGQAILLHITNIENPVCGECEPSLARQIEELAFFHTLHPHIALVTLNIRKNPYSLDGQNLSRRWWEVNATWSWVEDFEPFPLSTPFASFWTVDGSFSNPTILIIGPDGDLAAIKHVYLVGKGPLDGVQDADTLYFQIQALSGGTPGLGIESQIQKVGGLDLGDIPVNGKMEGTSALGMFVLGILTSLAPCSIALMIAVFSYILNSRRRVSREVSSSREGFMMGLAFTLGMALVFFFIGAFISQLGMFLRGSRTFDLAAGVVMILLGISNFKPLEDILSPLTRWLGKIRGRSMGDVDPGPTSLQRVIEISIELYERSALTGAFSLGVFFALGWAPCAVSLVFPVIIWLMAQDISPLGAGALLFAFGLGHGVPIIPIATFSRAAAGRIGDRYISAGVYTTQILGLLVIAVGVIYALRFFGITFW